MSERWNVFSIDDENVNIQRDLYSSFLIMNVSNMADKVERNKCIETFDGFKVLHDIEVERLRNSELSIALKNVI